MGPASGPHQGLIFGCPPRDVVQPSALYRGGWCEAQRRPHPGMAAQSCRLVAIDHGAMSRVIVNVRFYGSGFKARRPGISDPRQPGLPETAVQPDFTLWICWRR